MGVGVELDAWVELGKHLDRHSNAIEKMMEKPVIKPIGGSINVPSGFTTPVMCRLNGSPARGRIWNILKIGLFGTDPHTVQIPFIGFPAVPASGAAVQNTFPYTVQVTLSGFTLTSVLINGVQAGTTNGIYTVPANGTISITYSVLGTWSWSPIPNTPGVFADVYAGYVPPVAISVTAVPGGLQEVIIQNAVVPSIVNFSTEVEYCRSGEEIFALLFGPGLGSGQNYSVVARVAEYPERAVESRIVAP